VSGNGVTRGHCWDIDRVLETWGVFFFFWICEEEEEPWQLYVVLCRIWTFSVASELLETHLCCMIWADGFGLASWMTLAHLLKGVIVPA